MQLLKYSEEVTRGKAKQVLNMDNFIDTSNVEGRFEFSEWVRAYGKYLDEQLEVYGQISFYQVRSRAHIQHAMISCCHRASPSGACVKSVFAACVQDCRVLLKRSGEIHKA